MLLMRTAALCLPRFADAHAPANPAAGKAYAGRGQLLVRYDKRDAAGALLQLAPLPEVYAKHGITEADLLPYRDCSDAWLQASEGLGGSDVYSGSPNCGSGCMGNIVNIKCYFFNNY